MVEAAAPRVHVHPVRVYHEDTDATGFVYHANYLKFTERARTEFLRQLGIEHRRWRAEAGYAFVVRRCQVDYLMPARLDDAIEVHTRVLESRGASVEALQIVRRQTPDGFDDLVRMKVRIACVDRAGRPARLPVALRRRLAALIDDSGNRTDEAE